MSFVEAASPSEGPSIAVEGVLHVGEFIGPPNYGENPDSDRIERSYVLQLPAPLSTQVRNDNSLSGLTQESRTTYFIQLVVLKNEQPFAKKLIGKKVKVVGTLSERITGHHRTPVLVQVQSLSAIKGWLW